MRPRLRLFTGESGGPALADPPVSVRLADITRVLEDAVRVGRTWVHDFADDEVQISADLYDVLSAYWHLRPSA
jgi:DNA-binding IscR family transcriptional regulator